MLLVLRDTRLLTYYGGHLPRNKILSIPNCRGSCLCPVYLDLKIMLGLLVLAPVLQFLAIPCQSKALRAAFKRSRAKRKRAMLSKIEGELLVIHAMIYSTRLGVLFLFGHEECKPGELISSSTLMVSHKKKSL